VLVVPLRGKTQPTVFARDLDGLIEGRVQRTLAAFDAEVFRVQVDFDALRDIDWI